jgi:hypothetical protein
MLLAFLLAAQTANLPAWTPVPMQGTAEGAVMTPIKAMFAGLAARDGAAILAQTRAEGGATVANEKADGSRSIRHMTWAEFAGGIKPGPEKYEERISDPAIEIDGDIAMVWAPFTFLVDGKAHHCGVNHFDLVREQGAWKVLNVTWSSRTTGCTPG